MFSNFTEETCTGTGNTIELAGATTGNIPFSEKYSNGDPVPYTIEDSGGTIKVEGIGTYVSATNDITRNDSWSYDTADTPDITINPGTNKTLSGGTHTIRCAITESTASVVVGNTPYVICNSSVGTFGQVFGSHASDTIYCSFFRIHNTQSFTSIEAEISANAAGNLRLGIYSNGIDGLPNRLLVDSGDIDASSIGTVSGTIALTLQPGVYHVALCSSDDIDPYSSEDELMERLWGATSGGQGIVLKSTAHTYGALPASLNGSSWTDGAIRPVYAMLS